MFANKSILITGGTGSFGRKFVKTLLSDFPDIKKIVIFSRDELKQYEMSQEFPESKYPQMRYFIGDVRDANRVKRACEDIDCIVHAAALKQVPTAEYNPMECIRTNIIGAENVINAAIDNGVKKVIALSTDKAAAPVNLYGATKLCSDKLFIAANNIKGPRDMTFSVVRYGNVLGSRGSVVPFFLKIKSEGFIPITHPEMTRFNITLDEGIHFVISAIRNSWGGELFVPKIPSYKVVDLAKALAPMCKIDYVGIRSGEKLHEEMITEIDSLNTYDSGSHYVILPNNPNWDLKSYLKAFSMKPVESGFRYASNTNTEWLNVEQLRDLVKKHVDPEFKV